MKITILPFFFCVVLSQNFTNYPCPEECACTIYQDYDGEFVYVNCAFKFIGINLTDFSPLETKVTSVLQVNCDPFYYSEVADKMFQYLYAFKALYFQSCGFDYIPEHALYGLGNLKKLQIYEATHLSIHANAFLNTPILEELVIVSSGLQSLASVHMPTFLQFVNFTNNYIESLSDSGMFDEGKIFYNMEFFILNKNKIAKLDRNFSLTLPAIIHISVEENIIAHVSDDSFRHLTNLEYADFTNNRISMLPDSLLSDAINLKALGIGFNPISSFPPGLFNATRKLEVLDLHQANIDNAVWNTLKTLSSLHELQLGENIITAITETNLNELDMLWYLNLSCNKIVEIKNRTFIHQQQLETLNLDNNLIDMIEPQGFHGLHTLHNLRLNGNKITFIHQDTFQPLPNLLLLNISFNFLEYFPPVSYLHNLYVLDLRYNNISWINKSCFIGLDSIAGINLSFNKIKVLTYDVFQAVPSLQLLVLSFNEIDVIEQSTFTKLGLKWIFLDNNRISDISEVFKEMSYLIQLDLHHNKIKGTLYTKYFRTLPSLQQLILSFNYFNSIESRAFLELSHLSFVDFRHNKISTLNPESIMFSELAKPSPVFYFVGNDFLCDCNLAWMRKCLDKWTDRCRALDIHEFEILHCYRGYKIEPFSLIKNANIDSMKCRAVVSVVAVILLSVAAEFHAHKTVLA